MMTTKTRPTSHLLLGHRGARGEHFENSRQGFAHALALAHDSMTDAADDSRRLPRCQSCRLSRRLSRRLVGIEFDVQVTQDGVVVVFHDDTLDRLYQHQGRIDQLSFGEITRATADSHAVLRLAEMPPLLKGYDHIELEVKTNPRTDYPLLIKSLADTLAPLNEDSAFANLPITLTSFDLTLLELLKTHPTLSSYSRGLLVEPVLPKSLANLTNTMTSMQAEASKLEHNISVAGSNNLYDIPYVAMRLGCDRIGLYYQLYDPKFIDLCQRFDIHTSAWTVNTTEEVKRLGDMGVHHIITDYPSIMLAF